MFTAYDMRAAKEQRRRQVFDDPQQCDFCPCVREAVAVPPKVTLPGISGLATGDCEPEECETECPRCKALSSFQDAITCSECRSRPVPSRRWCLCDEGDWPCPDCDGLGCSACGETGLIPGWRALELLEAGK